MIHETDSGIAFDSMPYADNELHFMREERQRRIHADHTGGSRAGIACYDSDLSSSPYFQVRPVQSQDDSALMGFGLADQLNRVQIISFSRADDVGDNGVGIYGYDSSGTRHEMIAAAAAGVRLAGRNNNSRVLLTDSGVYVLNNGKAVFEADTDHTYIRNPGSNADYWIALDDNGIAVCNGSTVLQRWS